MSCVTFVVFSCSLRVFRLELGSLGRIDKSENFRDIDELRPNNIDQLVLDFLCEDVIFSTIFFPLLKLLAEGFMQFPCFLLAID